MADGAVRQRPTNGHADMHDAEKGAAESEKKHGLHMPHRHKGGHRLPRGINEAGESHRKGIHPKLFLKACFKSSSIISTFVNVLWPFVVPAIALYFTRPELHKWIFALNYIAIVPTANLIGYAGQELARKLPKVFGVILETFLGSIVEIILLAILLNRSTHHVDSTLAKDPNFLVPVIRDAILGSILANLLLCLGVCFFVGGMRRDVQTFDSAISEVGSGLLLVAAFGLAIPRAFYIGVSSQFSAADAASVHTESLILHISRATAILLLIAFVVYVFFQMRSHHGLYDRILEADEEKDEDGHLDRTKLKLTLTECIIALVIALALVSLHAFILVAEIEPIIEEDNAMLSETFMGLILVPLVEKLSEHLTAVDEAWDNQMNFALVHILGSSLQTALLNTSIIVLAAWGIGTDMDLNFSTFQIVLLVLAVLVVGNFIRDRESNYLEGALLVIVYFIIAVAAYYFPNVENTSLGAESGGESGGSEGGEGAAAAARMVKMMLRV